MSGEEQQTNKKCLKYDQQKKKLFEERRPKIIKTARTKNSPNNEWWQYNCQKNEKSFNNNSAKNDLRKYISYIVWKMSRLGPFKMIRRITEEDNNWLKNDLIWGSCGLCSCSPIPLSHVRKLKHNYRFNFKKKRLFIANCLR